MHPYSLIFLLMSILLASSNLVQSISDDRYRYTNDVYADDYIDDNKLLSLLKRKYESNLNELQLRSDDDEKNSDNDDESSNGGPRNNIASNFANSNYGIVIPLQNGDSVNLCDGKYITIATAIHERIKDLLISACSGASGNIN